MKILLCSLNYAPELVGIGKYNGELVEWLVGRGHEVRVVTAYPYYPDWRIREEFGGGRWYRRERVELAAGPALVYRCPLWVPGRPSAIKRILHLFSFALSSAPVVAAQCALWRPDAVIGVEPTLFAAPVTLSAARLAGAVAWMHVQDFEAEAAFGAGLMKGAALRNAAALIEATCLRRFDRVSSISPRMCEKLRQKQVAADRVRLLPNWFSGDEIYPLATPSPMRSELAIPEDRVVALYAGNMSEKQGLESLVEAARTLRGHHDIVFVFAGNGAARHRLEAASADLPNVRFLPLQPSEKLNALLNLADIHLLPQRRGMDNLVMPSKLIGMMASGRPVVAGAEGAAEIAGVVADCGVVVPPEDGRAIAEAVEALARRPERRALLGRAGREMALARWSRDSVLADLERWMQEARCRSGGAAKADVAPAAPPMP